MMQAHPSQVDFAIYSLKLFAESAKKSHYLSEEFVDHLHEACKELITLSEVEDKIKKVNQLIQEMNLAFVFQDGPIEYPFFTTRSTVENIKNSIIAFEYFLNQQFRTRTLEYKVEEPLFREAVLLWRDVGLRLNPKQSVTKFTDLIKRTNVFLPEKQRYPLPENHF